MIVTYTALITLAILRDDFTRLDRQGLVMFLESTRKRMDGSLLLSKFAGLIECKASLEVQWEARDADLRLTYCTFVISALLNDLSGGSGWVSASTLLCPAYFSPDLQRRLRLTPGCEAQGSHPLTYCKRPIFTSRAQVDRHISQ